jgi:hypothetical protein
MPVTVDMAEWWSKRRFSCVSLAMSLGEILVVGCVVVSVQISKHDATPGIERLAGVAWLVGGIGSFGFAVVGLVSDSDRRTALLALVAAIVVFLVSGLPLMASA